MHPSDAEVRGLRDGDLVRIFNDRGACLAGLSVDDAVRPGVVQLSTGAWYDPDPADPGFCRHGNPNVLTADLPSSTLSQGCTGQLALVEVEAYRGTPPGLSVTRPPGRESRLHPGLHADCQPHSRDGLSRWPRWAMDHQSFGGDQAGRSSRLRTPCAGVSRSHVRLRNIKFCVCGVGQRRSHRGR